MAERPNHWTMVGSAVDGALQCIGAFILVAAVCTDTSAKVWGMLATVALSGAAIAVCVRHYLVPWLRSRNGGDHG